MPLPEPTSSPNGADWVVNGLRGFAESVLSLLPCITFEPGVTFEPGITFDTDPEHHLLHPP